MVMLPVLERETVGGKSEVWAKTMEPFSGPIRIAVVKMVHNRKMIKKRKC
jgi:hypothetical protein